MDDRMNPVESIFCEATGGKEVLSTESEWEKLKHSLVKLGLVMEGDYQRRLQDLWDKEQIIIKGRNNNENFGKFTQPSPCVTLKLIQNLVFQLYPIEEDVDTAIQDLFRSVTKQVNYFQDLLESWDVNQLDMQRVVYLAEELCFVNSKLTSCIQVRRNVVCYPLTVTLYYELKSETTRNKPQHIHEQIAEKEYTLLDLLLATESVRNSHRVISTDYSNRLIHPKTNALIWQQENMAIVDSATQSLAVSDVVFGGGGAALINRQKTGWEAYVYCKL